ncbi:MAG TPA: hypothetical protein VFD15_06925, partial [Clostridia bacterium]|nr:hypothetical protein [Clostridia bacterium]
EQASSQHLQKLHQMCSQLDQGLHKISNMPQHTMTQFGSPQFGSMGTSQQSFQPQTSQNPSWSQNTQHQGNTWGQSYAGRQYEQQHPPQYAQQHSNQQNMNYLNQSNQLQGAGDQYGRVDQHRLSQQGSQPQSGMGSSQFGSQPQSSNIQFGNQQSSTSQLQGTGDQYGRVEQHRLSQQQGNQQFQTF